MRYEEIRNSVPEGIPKKIKKSKPVGPKSVTLFFIVTMLIFAIFGSMIQYALGMAGVAITELFFLAVSVFYIKWKGHRLKDAFPIKKPKWTAILGTIVMWCGSYLLMIVLNLLIMAYNPDFPMNSDSEVITSSGYNWILLFLIVAVLPPICEEAMHRGVIQYGMKQKIKNPWVMALVIGLFFGVFHLSVSKFYYTALLGGVMGWIMYKTDNMVYSSLFHFVHNGSQIILMSVTGAVAIVPGVQLVPGSLVVSESSSGSSLIGGKLLNFTASALNAGLSGLTGFLEQDLSSVYYSTSVMLYSAGINCIILGLFIPLIVYAGNWLLTKDISPRRKPFFPKDPAERKAVRNRLLLATGCFLGVGLFTIVLAAFIAF